MKPLVIDLFCGLGGWADGFIAEGYDVVGFDIERHDYGTGGYPGQLVIQDVRTLHGSQFKDAAVIVASPPCQKYSYMAMPWSRGKKMAEEIRNDYLKYSDLNYLFVECFRLQREASEAAGRYIPLIVENVRGAIPWVGQSRWHYGSFHLWGDLPALMPITKSAKVGGFRLGDGTKTAGIAYARDGFSHIRHLTNQRESDHVKQGGDWFNKASINSNSRRFSSKSDSRKAASAQIAKIPFPLARHIAQAYKP